MITHFRGNLAAALETGHVLVIAGKTLDGARDFEVALTGGKVSEADVQLGVSVQFGEDCIVRSSKTDGQWDEGEREENLNDFTATNPIVPGERFKMQVLIGDAGFIISVDGQPFCTYAFRMPIQDVRTLVVQGDLQCITQIDHRCAFPVARPPLLYDDPRLEFSNDMPVPFAAGHIIVLTAMPFGAGGGRFEVRFPEGHNGRQMFHLSVRFGSRPVVVRNSQSRELSWNGESDACEGEFPFAMDEQFTMAIGMTRREFVVAVNGSSFCTYPYQVKSLPGCLNGMKVFGSMGGHLEVTAVDHIVGGSPDCEGFESYSAPGVRIL